MIAAIREIADKRIVEQDNHKLTADYLTACSMIFETGILSHEKVSSEHSIPIRNISEGLKWFSTWKDEFDSDVEVTLRSPLQKVFLAWQVNLTTIMYATQ